jgi:hypothetical protein
MKLGWAIFLAGCALHTARNPAAALEIVGFSSQKNSDLAVAAASNRALTRAAWVAKPGALHFTYTRTSLKLFTPEAAFEGLTAKTERQEPFGARAVIRVVRSAEEQRALAGRSTVHVRATARSLDLAVAQERADRSAIKQAIAACASGDAPQTGALTVVNYAASAAGQEVTVVADVIVSFGAAPPAPAGAFDVEREEVESD